MSKGKLVVIKETKTGENIEFQNTGNNEILSKSELIYRLEKGNSSYNEDYYIKHQNGNKYIVSKPDGDKKNNLG